MRASLTSLASFVAVLSIASSCAGPFDPFGPALEAQMHLASIEVIELAAADPDDVGISGLMRHNVTNEFLTGGGRVLAFSASGEQVAAPAVPPLPRSENGEPRAPFEVMLLEEGRYVLMSDDAGFLWDDESNELSEYFCVAPGLSKGPVLRQRNGALAVQGLEGLIAAAPRWYEPDGPLTQRGGRVRQELSLYRAWDGANLRTIDVSTIEEDIEGLAWTDDGTELLALAGSSLLRLDLDGIERERFILDGLDAPRGLARNGPRIYVADRYGGERSQDRVVVYDLETAAAR